MSNEKISIVIVNYNSTRYLIKLLNSLVLIKSIVGEIIIVDNNSQKFHIPPSRSFKVTTLINKTNLGFSKAVNQGIKKAKYSFILLLNPDTLIVDKSIEKIYHKILLNKQIGAIGGKIEPLDHHRENFSANTRPTFLTAIFEFTNLKKIFPNNFATKHFWVEKSTNLKNNKGIEVDSLCGAFILFRKYYSNNKQDINLFDEHFFLYLEDLDFCLKIKERGFLIIFDQSSKIKHKGGVSSASKYNIVLKHWYNSRNYFFRKHLNPIQGKIILIIFSIEKFLLSLYHHLRHETAE